MAKAYLDVLEVKQNHPYWFKFFRMLPGAMTSIILLAMLTGYGLFIRGEATTLRPLIFGTLIIVMIYFIRWLIRWFEYTLYTLPALFKLVSYNRTDFSPVIFPSASATLNTTQQRLQEKLPWDLQAHEIIHRFILPMVNESYEIIHETLTNLQKSSYPLESLAITIWWEERKSEHFLAVWERVSREFSGVFGYLSHTLHPADLPNELVGKWWNITRSAHQEYQKVLDHFWVTPDKILVTTLDADSNIDPQYLPVLTYTYLTTPDRKKKSYQPIIFFYNNFWDAPFFSKVVSLCNTFWIMFNAMKKYGTRNFSTHAQPLDGLIETWFWSVQTIVEDGHQYWRSYFAFDGDYECVPVFANVYQDANLHETFLKTAVAQYKQMRRRSHGAEDVAYAFCAWIERRKRVPFWRTLYDVMRLLEAIVLRSTLHLVLMWWIWFSLIKDIEINTFISLGAFVGMCMKFSYVIMTISIILQLLYCPWHKLPKRDWRKAVIFAILYIPLAGLVLVSFSWIPAFQTQIALMINKPMKKFNVTEKIRKT